MFVQDEARLAVGFADARGGLAVLAQGGWLLDASQAAYGDGITGLAKVGPPGVSKLVKVQVGDVKAHDHSAMLPLRWEAAGSGSRLFPVLDADIALTPAGKDATTLTLTGVYRPPLGSLGAMLDRVLLSRLAAATIHDFVGRLAEAIVGPSTADEPDTMARRLPKMQQ